MGAKILAFAGSSREKSFNKLLVQVAGQGAVEAGAEVTVIDLRNYRMPVFDEDLEAAEGAPEGAVALKQIMKEHDGFLIASPEYNSSVTALLKNAIDWASRASEGEKMLEAFSGKTAAIMSASPGGLGGLRGLVHLRAILGNIGVTVLPTQHAVGGAHSAFAEDGSMTDEKQALKVKQIGKELAELTSKLLA